MDEAASRFEMLTISATGTSGAALSASISASESSVGMAALRRLMRAPLDPFHLALKFVEPDLLTSGEQVQTRRNSHLQARPTRQEHLGGLADLEPQLPVRSPARAHEERHERPAPAQLPPDPTTTATKKHPRPDESGLEVRNGARRP